MRLDKMKLAGFKSFVDPTTIVFPSNLAGVVGPNGCGKSNIIDAVKWVMGESSAKTLRGESMSDVIFNGSTGRKPVGQASVELIFDNSDGRVGGEYAGYNQISIRREVNREAQSTYYLNNTRCRRKDITRIFLGTGLGPRSYSVIEQGMISRFIDAKPEELRIYIEEVAGISKYKDRRRETENRIRHTRENLARLNDVRDELDKQLATLQRQANAAERYKELKKEERKLKSELTVLNYRNVQEKYSGFELKIKESETAQEGKRADLRRIEAEIEELRQTHSMTTDTFNEVQQKFYSLGNEVTRLEQAITHQKERLQQLEQDQAQLEQEFAALTEHLQQDQDQIEELTVEIEGLTPGTEQAQSESELAQERLLEVEEQLSDWQIRWDDFNEESSNMMRMADVEKTKISHLQSQKDKSKQRIDQLSMEREGLSTEELAETIEVLKAQHEEAQSSLHELEETLGNTQETLRSERDREETLQQQIDDARNQKQEVSGDLTSLQALQKAALGESNEAVSSWLESNQLNNQARLAQKLDVEPGWEKAVETVLGSYLEAVCVDSIQDYKDALQSFSEGAVTLFTSGDAGVASSHKLLSKVKSDIKLGGVLNSVYVAEDLNAAYAKLSELNPQESIVTKQGVWLSSSWLRVNKVDDVKSGILVREKDIETKTAQLEQLTDQLGQLQQDHQACKQAISELQAKRDELQTRFNESNAKHAESQAELHVKQEQLAQTQNRIRNINQELSELQQAFDHAQNELVQAQSSLQSALDATQDYDEKRQSLLSERDDLRSSLESARMNAREAKEALHEKEIRMQTCQSQLETMKMNVNRLNQQLSSLSERREQLNLALQTQDDPGFDLDEQLQSKLEERLVVEQSMKEARSSLEQVDARMQGLDKERHDTEQAISSVRDKLEQIRIDSQTLKVRADTLLESLAELDTTLDAVAEELPEEADAKEWQSLLSQTESRISRLGAINLVAIDEFKVQSERKEYLDSQNEDLEKALQTLEDAIAKIDKETKDKFKATFDQVNSNLKELFPKVFGGGSAYLELTGESLLDTGVAIMARPPGKKNSSIHLLSGGEKALTAISLVFSIFKINPAPFCLLDEVDAPLDDTNVGRYCRLVKEMSEKLQFIFITHNKVAMEMADQLMGVTMHEPGCSRMVSVDVKQAVEMATV